MSDSEDEEEEEVFAGLSRPMIKVDPTCDDDDDDDDDNVEGGKEGDNSEVNQEETTSEDHGGENQSGSGLLGADEAFDGTSADALDLDPFRSAPGLDVSLPSAQKADPAAQAKQKWIPKGHISQRKLFVGGLPYTIDDASLTKLFSRYGKVQEAVAGVSGYGVH